MYKVIPDGTLIEIPDNAFGFVFNCYIPAVGYGQNVFTGEIQPTDILCRSEIPEEQYFERIVLPADYKQRRKRELERQEFDSFYVDKTLEDFRIKEWNRRLCGVWFWNYNPYKGESELIYITGLHYFYIDWWKFDGKWNDFRITDRNFFYVVSYCIEDEHCLGLNEIAKRKNGKTARAGCILYERTSRLPNHHGGIQSKTDPDAEEVFKKAVVAPWKDLPDFYRPTYDLLKGDNPGDELRFFNTTRRGQKAEEEQTQEALNSFIDYRSRNVDGYDGPLVLTYVSDESGKLKKDVSILERQNRVRFSREDVGHYLDTFHLLTTTVEVDEKASEDDYSDEFQILTKKSNPIERDKNGHTGTGLYTYFTPAFKSMFFDKYGHPDEERAKVYFLNTRAKLESEGDLRGLSSFKRKNPFTLKEAFSTDGKDSLFNPELLNRQLDEIMWRTDLTETGNLEWVDGFEFVIEKEVHGQKVLVPNELIWVPDPNGKFEKVKEWWPREPNKVFENYGKYYPNNNHVFRIGCDPFKYDKTKDKRRSNCAAFAFQIADPIYPTKYDDMFVLKYSQRPEGTKLANYEIMKMAWLCGCQTLFERNFNHWKGHFTDWKCDAFLMWLPGEVEPGIYTDGKGTVTQTICNYTEAHINQSWNRVFFKSLIQKDGGWLGFKVENTQESDEPMAAGFTLIAVKGKKYIRTEDIQQDIEDILPQNYAA